MAVNLSPMMDVIDFSTVVEALLYFGAAFVALVLCSGLV